MKKCSCGAVNPAFSTKCIQCGTAIGPSEYDKKLEALEKLRAFRAVHGTHGVWASMMTSLVPGEENVEPRLREQLRRECELFYANWASEIGTSFSREELNDYLSRFATDTMSASQVHQLCQELMHVIESRAGIQKRYQEKRTREHAEKEKVLAREKAERERRLEEERREQAEWERQQRDATWEQEQRERVRREAPTAAWQAGHRLLSLSEAELERLQKTAAELENAGLDPGIVEEELSVIYQRIGEVEEQVNKMREMLSEME